MERIGDVFGLRLLSVVLDVVQRESRKLLGLEMQLFRSEVCAVQDKVNGFEAGFSLVFCLVNLGFIYFSMGELMK